MSDSSEQCDNRILSLIKESSTLSQKQSKGDTDKRGKDAMKPKFIKRVDGS